MAELDEFEVNVGSGELDKLAEQSKKKLSISLSTERALVSIQNNMRERKEIGKIVEIAIELLVKAQGREIRLVDKNTGEVFKSYFLWRE